MPQWVRRWDRGRPRCVSLGHWEALRRLAIEIEARTNCTMFVDHRNAYLFFGKDGSPFGVYSTSAFREDGMACMFERWRDGIGRFQGRRWRWRLGCPPGRRDAR